MNQDKIGKFIKEIRKKNKLTQNEFASKYNVTYQAVSNWEHGKNLPDIALLNQMSKDFNVSMEDILNGKSENNRKKIMKLGLLVLTLIFLICAFVFFDNSDDFEFKTITSNCSNFNISGSISYSKNKTSIYINNVNYCGGEDNTEYKNIECSLYEQSEESEIKISVCDSNNDKIKLEDYLKQIEFTVSDYDRKCKNYNNNSLFLRINATDEIGKTTTYKIPLSLNNTCKK